MDFNIGQKVTLVLAGVSDIPGDLKKYDREQTTISKVNTVNTYKGGHSGYYYELNGVVSRMGVPYAIAKEWLFAEE